MTARLIASITNRTNALKRRQHASIFVFGSQGENVNMKWVLPAILGRWTLGNHWMALPHERESLHWVVSLSTSGLFDIQKMKKHLIWKMRAVVKWRCAYQNESARGSRFWAIFSPNFPPSHLRCTWNHSWLHSLGCELFCLTVDFQNMPELASSISEF